MIPEQPRGYSIRLKPQADRILVVEPVSQFAYVVERTSFDARVHSQIIS